MSLTLTLLISLACTGTAANTLYRLYFSALYVIAQAFIVSNKQMSWEYMCNKAWIINLFSFPRLLLPLTLPTIRHILDPPRFFHLTSMFGDLSYQQSSAQKIPTNTPLLAHARRQLPIHQSRLEETLEISY
ncbi:uncharacterized protein F5891DRAFT_18867 [Suillus fuscotomentosus]|uniref:Secreted protein n=1 Tax=Suillus fuscotomentosus TaxID=1912939 RepID=A0AAD4EM00_9AGAM|nr:uncharacterized protein F5891DRAFT_18867 [Suillus fuscotomentosus]KAG1908552.1 hypothetical protein F5891DRAFT_18867 [Suillus fuscotomentosus]